MIKVKDAEKPKTECDACDNVENLRTIVLGKNPNATSSFTLCEHCITRMIRQFTYQTKGKKK